MFVRSLIAVAACLFSLMLQTAIASEATDAVAMVAHSRMSTVARINGKDRSVFYVGQFQGCDSVAIQNGRDRYEHYRVCGQQVIPRNTVSPSWSEAGGARSILKAVTTNAVLYGSASQQDPNGYLISARALGGARRNCSNIEVIISYDGDLVDQALKSICSRAH